MNITIAPATNQRHREHFEVRPGTLHAVRAFITDHLRGCPAVADVALAAHEYAANAILYSRAGEGEGFDVALEVTPGARVRLEVHDPGPVTPGGPADPRPCDEHGRGLDIVAELALTSGHEHHRDGRQSWAEFGWPPTTRRSTT